MKKPSPEQSKSYTFGIDEPYIAKSQPPPAENLSLQGILLNLFGKQHMVAFLQFLDHYGVPGNRHNLEVWLRSNYLPPHVAALLDEHGLAFAEELIAEGTEIYHLRVERWAESRRICSAYAKSALTAALSGQNAKVSIRPTNPIGRPVGWRKVAQKPLQIREALARGAAPGAHAEATPNQTTAPKPIADLLEAWFPPRPKNPPIER